VDPRDRLIVALDLDDVARAESVVARLGDAATFYKIGYQLAFNRGLPFARDLAAAGKKVFLDMKLHDIPNTVSKGVEAIADMGMSLLTVHAYPQTMRAAADGARGSGLTILGVTVLTSCDEVDLAAAGYAFSVADLVSRRALQAEEAGIGGLVLSPQEVAAIRRQVAGRLILVTPGVRPEGTAAGDQKRVMTPAQAIRAGADQLVVGRPITAAADPVEATRSILDEIASGAT
jgi:orotidine-5'-phosphate decarboxylase